MKTLLVSCMAFFAMSITEWQPDFSIAKAKAVQDHRIILLSFSGSDWCIPCIRMHKEIFDSPQFYEVADSSLILYNADFPRKKKNELSKQLRMQNDSLAAVYNPEGKFPFTLLLSSDGKVLRSWEGYPEGGMIKFLEGIKETAYAYKH